jgi:antirestriction protein ArdC
LSLKFNNPFIRKVIKGIASEINVKTGKLYNGENCGNLEHQRFEKQYKSKIWGTYLQWKENGRMICEGEKGTSIFHPASIATGKLGRDGKEKFKSIYKFWKVFNEEQTKKLEVV